MARPVLVAVQPSLRPGVPPGTVGVVQPGFWEAWAGAKQYVYDGFSAASVIATIISAIASAANASGLGWLAPLAIPAIGAAVQGLLANRDENLVGPDMRQKDLSVFNTFVGAVAGAIGVMVASGAVTPAAVTTGIVSFIMIIAEILRVQWLDRETIYGLVRRKIQECRGGENAQLLPN